MRIFVQIFVRFQVFDTPQFAAVLISHLKLVSEQYSFNKTDQYTHEIILLQKKKTNTMEEINTSVTKIIGGIFRIPSWYHWYES